MAFRASKSLEINGKQGVFDGFPRFSPAISLFGGLDVDLDTAFDHDNRIVALGRVEHFEEGMRVRVSGLQKQAELNGLAGVTFLVVFGGLGVDFMPKSSKYRGHSADFGPFLGPVHVS